MHGKVVDGSGDSPAGLMDQGDGVVAEERIRSAGKADVVLDITSGLREVHPLQVVPESDALIEGGEGAQADPATKGWLAQDHAGKRRVRIHLRVAEQP